MPRRCEVRWLLSLTAVLLCLFAVDCQLAEQDPDWRCICRFGFTPCGGRCYARLDKKVNHKQAGEDCEAIGAILAVPHSRHQNLCVAGLAGYKSVWLGITDKNTEGVYVGADEQLILPNEGQVWAVVNQALPSGTAPGTAVGGNDDCLQIQKLVVGGKFAEWSAGACNDNNYPMCQLKSTPFGSVG